MIWRWWETESTGLVSVTNSGRSTRATPWAALKQDVDRSNAFRLWQHAILLRQKPQWVVNGCSNDRDSFSPPFTARSDRPKFGSPQNRYRCYRSVHQQTARTAARHTATPCTAPAMSMVGRKMRAACVLTCAERP